ncbi:MAG: AraC-like DNA-binding protein [Myxococcota bacterium]|jgi:AraC-like DNA-binding protein
MPNSPASIADRPSHPEHDVLSDVLSQLRVRGSLFSRAELSHPWGVHTTGTPTAMFHVVLEGAGWARTSDGQHHGFRAGDLILFPRGSAHELTAEVGLPTAHIAKLPREDAPGLPIVRHGGGGRPTSLLCGTFELGLDGRDFLLGLLPDIVHVRGGSGHTAAWLDATLALLAHEVKAARPGHELLVRRLAEVLFVQVLRAWVQQEGVEHGGWLGALSDPHIGRALGRVHGEPGGPWTARSLADAAGLSRSAFYTRFDRLVGQPPSQYLLRWRMCLARRALREGSAGMAQIAGEVGYASEAAFSRAFKREVGVAPSVFRAG